MLVKVILRVQIKYAAPRIAEILMRLLLLATLALACFGNTLAQLEHVHERTAVRIQESEDVDIVNSCAGRGAEMSIDIAPHRQWAVIKNNFVTPFDELNNEVTILTVQRVSRMAAHRLERDCNVPAPMETLNEQGTLAPISSGSIAPSQQLLTTIALSDREENTNLQMDVDNTAVESTTTHSDAAIEPAAIALQPHHLRRILCNFNRCIPNYVIIYSSMAWMIIAICVWIFFHVPDNVPLFLALVLTPMVMIICNAILFVMRQLQPRNRWAVLRRTLSRIQALRTFKIAPGRNANEADTCSICFLDLFTFLNTCCELPCRHIFHAACMKTWAETLNGHTCPVCRAAYVSG